MKTLLLRTLVTIVLIQALFLASPASVQAEETCPPHTPVSIDVRPGDEQNKINLSSRGLLPVAVLSSADFDATAFTPEMAHLSDASMAMGCEGAAAVRWNHTDVDGDGLVDLLFFFRSQDLNLTFSSTQVMLMAHGTYNSMPIHIHGMDSVKVKS